MAIHQFKTTQKLPITLHEAWDFMSSPHNLQKITPPHMDFSILNGVLASDKMYAGQMIAYHVRPLLGIKMEWVTEITVVNDLKYFIDEQRFGPYAMWHHEHFFKTIEGGVQMDDIVHYKMPYGFLGNIGHSLFIKKKLKELFDHRYKKLEELFGRLI